MIYPEYDLSMWGVNCNCRFTQSAIYPQYYLIPAGKFSVMGKIIWIHLWLQFIPPPPPPKNFPPPPPPSPSHWVNRCDKQFFPLQHHALLHKGLFRERPTKGAGSGGSHDRRDESANRHFGDDRHWAKRWQEVCVKIPSLYMSFWHESIFYCFVTKNMTRTSVLIQWTTFCEMSSGILFLMIDQLCFHEKVGFICLDLVFFYKNVIEFPRLKAVATCFCDIVGQNGPNFSLSNNV